MILVLLQSWHSKNLELKIAYLSNSVFPSRSANSIQVMKMCQAFAKLGNDVFLFGRTKRRDNKDEIFRFYDISHPPVLTGVPWLPVRGRSTIYAILSAILARLKGCDLAYGRDVKSCYFACLLGLKTIYESHAPVSLLPDFDRRIYLRLIGNGNLVLQVVISEALRKIYEAEGIMTRNKFIVAHDGADMERNGASYHWDRSFMHVGYIGHLYQGRGMEILLSLAEHCSWAMIHVIGGTDEDVEYWRRRSESLGNLKIYGHMPYGEAKKYRNSMDVLVAPFEREVRVHDNGVDTSTWMSPLKIFEYMSSGKPILCSDLPVIREVLSDGVNAVLVEPDNVGEWIGALRRLKEDAGYRRRLGNAAARAVKEKYSWEVRAREILEAAGA